MLAAAGCDMCALRLALKVHSAIALVAEVAMEGLLKELMDPKALGVEQAGWTSSRQVAESMAEVCTTLPSQVASVLFFGTAR